MTPDFNSQAVMRILEQNEIDFEKRRNETLRMLTPLERKLVQALQTCQTRCVTMAHDSEPQAYAQQTADYIATVIDDALGRRDHAI